MKEVSTYVWITMNIPDTNDGNVFDTMGIEHVEDWATFMVEYLMEVRNNRPHLGFGRVEIKSILTLILNIMVLNHVDIA